MKTDFVISSVTQLTDKPIPPVTVEASVEVLEKEVDELERQLKNRPEDIILTLEVRKKRLLQRLEAIANPSERQAVLNAIAKFDCRIQSHIRLWRSKRGENMDYQVTCKGHDEHGKIVRSMRIFVAGDAVEACSLTKYIVGIIDDISPASVRVTRVRPIEQGV